ncbi:MAG: hypothetical protein HYU41_21095 [Candidatus Rokubacteria bacterium]|nr:hypothetical protein [Candidatus Rokubacteria bacterium]
MRSETRPLGILLALLFTLIPVLAFADVRPEAVLTEVRHGIGAILIVKSGQTAARPAEPLMTLGPDDKVIARGDARAVVLFPGGATKTVTKATSPLTVPALDDEQAGELRGALTRLYGVLKGGTVPRMYVQMGTRLGKAGGTATPLVRFLPDSVIFDWRARQGAFYEVTVAGDEGARWTHTRAAPPLAYPQEAPALMPGAVYEFRVRSNQAIIEQSFFEVASDEEQTVVRAELAELDALPAPPVTRALLRGSYLASARFLPSARRELESAVETHPADASLRSLLASVYTSLGRGDLAEKERRVAKSLTRLTVK